MVSANASSAKRCRPLRGRGSPTVSDGCSETNRSRIRIAVPGLVDGRGSALLLTPSDSGYRCGKPVTAGCDRLNAASLGTTLIENPAERRDLDGQVGVLDHRPPPDGRHDLFFGHQFARSLDEHAQNIEPPGPNG